MYHILPDIKPCRVHKACGGFRRFLASLVCFAMYLFSLLQKNPPSQCNGGFCCRKSEFTKNGPDRTRTCNQRIMRTATAFARPFRVCGLDFIFSYRVRRKVSTHEYKVKNTLLWHGIAIGSRNLPEGFTVLVGMLLTAHLQFGILYVSLTTKRRSKDPKEMNHITKECLATLTQQGLSSHKIAENLGVSQTTIRYHLKKHGISIAKERKLSAQPAYCLICGLPLSGMQIRYCGSACHSKANNNTTYAAQQERGILRKKTLVTIMGGKCHQCGYCKNFSALCFHHQDPQEKSFSLDLRSLSNRKWKTILEEAKKCTLVCQNCHAEIHNPQCLL